MVELEQQAAILAGDALVRRIGGRSLLHDGECLLFLALRLEIARVVERDLRVLGILPVGLAPIFGGFGQLGFAVAGWSGGSGRNRSGFWAGSLLLRRQRIGQ